VGRLCLREWLRIPSRERIAVGLKHRQHAELALAAARKRPGIVVVVAGAAEVARDGRSIDELAAGEGWFGHGLG
jgi:hypothetical protein